MGPALPYSVREKAVNTALRLLARRRREAENKVTITRAGQGMSVCCTVLDGQDTLLSISLWVPDLAQAEAVKRRFLKDPSAVYRAAVALMTDRSEPNGENLDGPSAGKPAD